jgi:anti-sigma regulatory factor (Ser/Thr protein kinase)
MAVPARERFTIDFPGDPLYLSTVRLFTSAVVRHYQADEDTIGDVKVAVSEACAAFLRGDQEEGSIRVAVIPHAGALTVEVTSTDLSLAVPPKRMAEVDTPTPSGMAAELGLELLRSLFEGAEVVSNGGSAIRFSVPLAGSTA